MEFKQRFSRKLAWRIVLSVSIVMIVLSVIIYKMVNRSIIEMESMLFTEVMRRTSETINSNMTSVSVGCINSLDKIESSLDKPDSIPHILQRVVAQNPNIAGCAIGFEANYYPQKGRWYEPYAIRNGEQIVVHLIGGPNHDYLNREWYQSVMTGGSSGWSHPYYDAEGCKTVVATYALPVKNKGGKKIGVFALDLSLYWLADIMRKTDAEIVRHYYDPFFKTAQVNCIILNKEGTYVAHSDTTRIIHCNFLSEVKASADTNDDLLARQILSGKEGHSESTIDDERHIVFYCPIENTDWTVAVVVPWILYYGTGQRAGIMLMVLIALSLLVAFFGCVIAIRKMTNPLVKFAESTREIAKGNFQAPLPNIKSNDEIGLLHESFQDMQQSLSRYVEQLRETTASKAAIENELNIARNIQMSMIPKIFPPYPQRDDIDIYGYMQPAKDVGGDLFDFFIHDEKLFFCIGDVSGKGIPAALLMTVAKNLFRSVTAHESSPGKIITQMNNTMSEGNEANMFVTLFVGVLDLSSGRLSYCNAGHDAPLIISSDATLLPVESHFPVGVMAGAEFDEEEITIAPQTTLFLFTDGLTEAACTNNTDDEWELFGMQRVMDTIHQAMEQRLLEPRPFTEHILHAVSAFVGDSLQSDDLTMLTIRYM